MFIKKDDSIILECRETRQVVWEAKSYCFTAEDTGGNYMITVISENIDIQVFIFDKNNQPIAFGESGSELCFPVSLVPNESCHIQVLSHGQDGYYYVSCRKTEKQKGRFYVLDKAGMVSANFEV